MSEAAPAQPDSRETTIEECACWRERAHDGANTREIAVGTRFSRSTVGKHVRNGEGCGHATAAETGVEPITGRRPSAVPLRDAQIERVCDVLAALVFALVGGTIHARPGVVADEAGVSSHCAGAVLALLAEESRHGLMAERANPGANLRNWIVQFVDGESA